MRMSWKKQVVLWLLCVSSVFATFALAKTHVPVPAKIKSSKKAEKKPEKVSPLPEPVSAWKGSNAALGFVANSGNSRNMNLNLGLKVNYVKNRWTNKSQGTAQFGSNNGQTNQERYFVLEQLNYSLNDNKKVNNYLFVNGNVTFDHFSPFTYQYVISGGYGRDWIKTPRFAFSTQLGPGYRRSKQADSGAITENLLFTTEADVNWQIGNNTTFSESAVYNIGRAYNYLKSTTALTNKLTHNLSSQISFMVENYSQLPANSTNLVPTNTTTNISLIYNF